MMSLIIHSSVSLRPIISLDTMLLCFQVGKSMEKAPLLIKNSLKVCRSQLYLHRRILLLIVLAKRNSIMIRHVMLNGAAMYHNIFTHQRTSI